MPPCAREKNGSKMRCRSSGGIEPALSHTSIIGVPSVADTRTRMLPRVCAMAAAAFAQQVDQHLFDLRRITLGHDRLELLFDPHGGKRGVGAQQLERLANDDIERGSAPAEAAAGRASLR